MRIVHAIRSDGFAGVERHVARLAHVQRQSGHQVLVIGGDPARMIDCIADPLVAVVPARTTWQVVRALRRWGRGADIVHAHMTAAEVAVSLALFLRPRRPAVVSTRHFAGRRGRGPLGGLIARLARAPITSQIAISQYVADSIGEPSTVVAPGIEVRRQGRTALERLPIVLVAQRLEPEKRTDLGLRAFAASGLSNQGWELHVAGDGSQRATLEQLARDLGVAGAVRFLGTREDVEELMATSSMLLAPCPIEGLGLSVVEAMAGGLPVVAAGAGGHLELLEGLDSDALYDAGDHEAAGRSLARLASAPHRRNELAAAAQRRQQSEFSPAAQVTAMDEVYHRALDGTLRRPAQGAQSPTELIVLSLEAWDEVWRRNQYFVSNIVADNPALRVLFVEPAADPLHQVVNRRKPQRGRGLRAAHGLADGSVERLKLYQPTKWLPRRIDPWVDTRLSKQVIRAARRAGLRDPVLWVNDPAAVELAVATGWRSLYDVTDDWLAASRTPEEHRRLVRDERLLLATCDEVTVCSEHLVQSKGEFREVTLITNGVDVDRYVRPCPRPDDLPDGPIALYVGTVHPDRFDVALLVATAEAANQGTLVVVGPVMDLTDAERDSIAHPGIVLLGPRPWDRVPAYLQHASVLMVPHLVNEFTDSLDPIKLYEYRAAGVPVVSTPVAGFRDSSDPLVTCATAAEFPSLVAAALGRQPTRRTPPGDLPTWSAQGTTMWDSIERAWRVRRARDL